MVRWIAVALLLFSSVAIADDDHPRIQARAALKCLHPTARFVRLEKLSDAWEGAAQYGADSSEVDRIHFAGGVTYHPYVLDAAVIWRKGMVRIVVLQDTAPFPPNDRCALLNWNG